MPPVMILTDSTAYLPTDLVSAHPIRVLPLTLNWDGKTYRDGVDIQATEFYTRLAKSSTLPTTSQIPAGEVETAIRGMLAEGFDVLMLPISSGISGTYQTAYSTLPGYPQGHVMILDTKLVSMALGFQVLAAARAAQAGASLADCAEVARKAYDQIGVYFTVDTLKYLAAGGRINTAKRFLGSVLNIKPILEIRDGKIEPVSSVRTMNKAVESMLDLVEAGIQGRTPVRISVFHALAHDLAVELMRTVQQRFSPVECILSEVSPVVGSHVGPGTISIAYQAGG